MPSPWTCPRCNARHFSVLPPCQRCGWGTESRHLTGVCEARAEATRFAAIGTQRGDLDYDHGPRLRFWPTVHLMPPGKGNW